MSMLRGHGSEVMGKVSSVSDKGSEVKSHFQGVKVHGLVTLDHLPVTLHR